MTNSNSRSWAGLQTTKFDASNHSNREEWPATRIEDAAGDTGSEWQATRILPNDGGGHEWPVSRGPAQTWRDDDRQASGQQPAPGRLPVAPDAWADTRAHTALATQLFADEAKYLAGEHEDIGRQIGNNEHELFVSCAPAEALQQQLAHRRPEFIAVHDIATASSRKLIAGIAAASGRTVQKLVVRRQGYGTALATLEFVDLPTADSQGLRLYTTEAECAEPAQRQALAASLLAYSRLGVVMVGELPGQAIAQALKPLHDSILAGPWPNRNLLLLPLVSASTLVTHGLELSRGTGVAVRTTPQVARPADAWTFITGTWSRLREQAANDGQSVPELGAFRPAAYQPGRAASAQPLGSIAAGADLPVSDAQGPIRLALHAASPASVPALASTPPAALIDRYVARVSELTGVVGVCVFDIRGGRAMGHSGSSSEVAALAKQGCLLLTAMSEAGQSLGHGHSVPEAAITLGSHHLLLRAVPRNAGLAMHVLLDRASANLTLARLQILRMDTMFDEPSAA